MTDRRRATSLVLAAWASVTLLSTPAAASNQASDTTSAIQRSPGLKAKGYLSARYAYIGSSSPATVYSGMQLIGSFELSALSDKVVFRYRSHHWLNFERTSNHVLESAFENRHIIQTAFVETDGLLFRGLKTQAGRFFPEMDYASCPVIDGGALAYEAGSFLVGGAAGRMVDPWSGNEGSSDILTSGLARYSSDRLRVSAGFQSATYVDIKQKEVPAGFNVMLTRNVWLEAYGGYDFEFRKLSRAGLSLALHGDAGSLSLSASQWRNPFDQLYLLDKSHDIAYWGLYSKSVPSTYDDVRLSGSYARNGWGVRGTLGSMAGVRSGWTANAYVTPPSFGGALMSFGGQGIRSDYIEFYSVDGRLLYELGGVALEIQSQYREYTWLPGSSAPRTSDAYSEVSAEYPLRKHVYLSAGGGGFFRTIGNEGFKPQAELRLIARI
ncbi:MAG: hypothetical protein ABR899_01150 [Candidatus Krumholzibacteriaceae bacterium]